MVDATVPDDERFGDQPVLGGWHFDGRRIEGDQCGVKIDKGEATHIGARTRIRVEFDVTMGHGTGSFLNRLIQEMFDGFAAGAFDIVGDSLIEMTLLDAPKTPPAQPE